VSLSLSLFISHSLIDGLHYSCILHLLEDLFESGILVARNIFGAFECVYCSLCTRVVLFYLFVVIVFLIVFASNFPRRRHKKVQFFHGWYTASQQSSWAEAFSFRILCAYDYCGHEPALPAFSADAAHPVLGCVSARLSFSCVESPALVVCGKFCSPRDVFSAILHIVANSNEVK